jgi:hypothetical protein
MTVSNGNPTRRNARTRRLKKSWIVLFLPILDSFWREILDASERDYISPETGVFEYVREHVAKPQQAHRERHSAHSHQIPWWYIRALDLVPDQSVLMLPSSEFMDS